MPRQTNVQSDLAVRRLARECRPRPWAQSRAQSPAADGPDRSCSVRTETKPQVSRLPQLTTSRKSPKAKSQASPPAAADGSDRSCSKLSRPATDRSDGSCKVPTAAKPQAASTPRGILKRQQPLHIAEAQPQASSTGVGGSDRNSSTTSGIPIRRQPLNTTEAKSQASSLAATDGSDRSRPASSGIPIRRQPLDIASTAEVGRSDCLFRVNPNKLDSESRPRRLQHINEAWSEDYDPAGSEKSDKVTWRKVIRTIKTYSVGFPRDYWDGWKPKYGWPDEDESDEED